MYEARGAMNDSAIHAKKKRFRVVLFGDSLINNSCEEF